MGKQVRILLIDDEPDFLQVTAMRVQAMGYPVLTADNGPDGIELVRNKKADVVIVDYKMPGMDGDEVIRKIREFNDKIPVAMATAYAHDAVADQQKKLKIWQIFFKPKFAEDMENTIERLAELAETPPE